MRFERLVEIAGDEAVFDTGLLLAGNVNPANVRRQLSRWTAAGRLTQLRRGLYALTPPFQKLKPHPFLVANRVVHGSYVSCQSALAYYDLIPEYTPTVTSVTAARPGRWATGLGIYEFHHIKSDLFWGYQLMQVAARQQAFIATPEKALLDLIYLQPGGDSADYLRGLRLQNMEILNRDDLLRYAARAKSPKLQRAAKFLVRLAQEGIIAYEKL